MAIEKTKVKDTRAKNWTVVLYPESAPENWLDILTEMHIEYIISPLHDKDINATGEVKKAHWHILLMFGSLKSYEQVLEVTQVLNCPSPQKCHNSKAMVRYMAHLDNPEKAQYDANQIKGYGGVDLAELLKPSSSERYNLVKDMIIFTQENDITEYQDLVDYSLQHRYDDWFPALCDNCSLIMINYLRSARHRTNKPINYLTGEIVETGGSDDGV